MTDLILPKSQRDAMTEELNWLIEHPPLIPVGPHLLVRVEDVATESAGGIVLGTASAMNREQMGAEAGYVIAVGPTAYDGLHCEIVDDVAQPWCKIGDKVFFKRYAGKVPEIDGLKPGTIRVLEDEEVIAKWPTT